jgi:hypothetical protein
VHCTATCITRRVISQLPASVKTLTVSSNKLTNCLLLSTSPRGLSTTYIVQYKHQHACAAKLECSAPFMTILPTARAAAHCIWLLISGRPPLIQCPQRRCKHTQAKLHLTRSSPSVRCGVRSCTAQLVQAAGGIPRVWAIPDCLPVKAASHRMYPLFVGRLLPM